MNTDPIADYLTRIRNASSAGLKVVDIPASNVKKSITKILMDQGFITNFKFEKDEKQGSRHGHLPAGSLLPQHTDVTR